MIQSDCNGLEHKHSQGYQGHRCVIIVLDSVNNGCNYTRLLHVLNLKFREQLLKAS